MDLTSEKIISHNIQVIKLNRRYIDLSTYLTGQQLKKASHTKEGLEFFLKLIMHIYAFTSSSACIVKLIVNILNQIKQFQFEPPHRIFLSLHHQSMPSYTLSQTAPYGGSVKFHSWWTNIQKWLLQAYWNTIAQPHPHMKRTNFYGSIPYFISKLPLQALSKHTNRIYII